VSVGRLPAEVSSFVGRAGEIAAATAALGTTRLLTLVGPGGVGKTRLAQRVAADVAASFPGGVRFVALGKLAPGAAVAPAILQALGHRDDAPDAAAALEARLADERLLLVLDNCEHVLDGTVALVDRLLRTAAGLTVLATSRHVLGADGERVVVVPPLSTAAGADGGVSEAAELFRTRAIAAGADLEDAVDTDIDRVCRHLDGVPLALELAAVRLRSVPLAELVRHLGDILPLLGPNGSAADHHDALEVTLAWSHRLCDEAERRAWRLLSVFRGPFDIDGAQAVLLAPRTEVVRVLGRLLDKSVVQRRSGGGPPYTLLETVRQYGRTMLRADPEARRAILDHRAHYFRLGARGATDYVSERDLEWFNAVRENLADLRIALAEGVTDAETRAGAVEAIVELRPYWAHTGLTREGLELVRHALAFEPDGTVARAGLLCAGAQLAALLGLTAEAHALAEQCAGSERTSPRITAELVEHRGLLALLEGRAREAVDLALVAVEQLERSGPFGPGGGGVTDALMVACTAALETGDERLPALSERNLRLTRQAGSRLTLATASWLAGVLQWRSGDPAAEATLDGALELFRPFEQSTFVGMTLEAKACLAAARGRPRLAARLFGACAALWSGGPPFPRHISDRVSAASRAAVRSALGPAAFAEQCAAGAKLSRSAAIATALAAEDPVEDRSEEGIGDGVRDGGSASALTAREQQVAELVAAGLSNRAIAERLVIAPRTAEAHVEHIRTKLGFRSRTQIAAWIAGWDRGAAARAQDGRTAR
jgi:predicted ATPase/DNA-binding CsgD family transcriptional regulator